MRRDSTRLKSCIENILAALVRGSRRNSAERRAEKRKRWRKVFVLSGLRPSRKSRGFAVCLGFAWLDDQRAFGVERGLCAYVFEAIVPVVPEEVET